LVLPVAADGRVGLETGLGWRPGSGGPLSAFHSGTTPAESAARLQSTIGRATHRTGYRTNRVYLSSERPSTGQLGLSLEGFRVPRVVGEGWLITLTATLAHSPTTGNTTIFRLGWYIVAMNWRRLPWYPSLRPCPWNAGNPSSAPASAKWTLWPSIG